MRRVIFPRTFLLLAATAMACPVLAEQPVNGPENDAGAGYVLAPELPDGTPPEIVSAVSGSGPVTQLADALRRAYWTNPSLLSQRAALRGTDYRVPQARSSYGPKLNYSLTYGWQRDNFEQAAGGYFAVQGWSTTASAILTQPLFTFGRNSAQERVALAQRDYQSGVLRSAEQQAMFDAIGSYVGLLRDRFGVQIAADNLDLLERELTDNQARFKVREVTSTDLQQVETRVELGRAQLLRAKRDAASSEASFLRAVGTPAGELAAPNPLSLPVRSLEEAYAFAELHNPIVSAAQARERVSRASLDAARSDLLPRIDLRGTADYGTVTPYSNSLRQTELRGEVVISGPIFESGLRQARLGEAEAANDSDWRLIDAAVRENRATLASNWSEWQAQKGSIERLAGAVESAMKAYDGALLQERAGMRTTLDVLDLARELLAARNSYNDAVASAYIAQARLLAAMGTLEQAYLLPDDPRYDDDAHYQRVRRRSDVPLLTPLIRAIDGIQGGGGSAPRPLRDPAASTVAPGFTLPEAPPPAP